MDTLGPFSFPDALRQYRESARMSRASLADQVGRSEASVARWETGHNAPRRSTLVRIADVLGITVQELDR